MPKYPDIDDIRDDLETRFLEILIDHDVPEEDSGYLAHDSVAAVLQACFHLIKEKKYKYAVLGRWKELGNVATSTSWPIEDDPQVVAEWCQDRMSQRPPLEWVEEFVALANSTWKLGAPPIVKEGRIKLPIPACAVVYEAYHQIEEDRELEAIQVGTDEACFSFYMALNYGADPKRYDLFWYDNAQNYVILDTTGSGYQVRIHGAIFVRTAAYLVGKDGNTHFEALEASNPSEFMEQDTEESKDVKALQKKFFGPFAMRLWAALLAEGQDGEFHFDPEYTLGLMKYSKRYMREPKVQDDILMLVNLYRHTRIYRKARVDDYDLEPIKGQYNVAFDPFFKNRLSSISPELIGGGTKNECFLLPADLCDIDHRRVPHVYPLSFFLSVMFQRSFQNGKQFVEIPGKHLLTLLRISRFTKKTRVKLQTSMDMLVKAQVIDQYEWVNFPWAVAGTIRFEAPRWVVERLLYGIEPIEPVTLSVPQTGEELRSFRKKMYLTQEQLAQLVGVSRATINRNEQAEYLPTRFLDKLKDWRMGRT